MLFCTTGLFSVKETVVLDGLDSSFSGSSSPNLYLLFIGFGVQLQLWKGKFKL